MTWEFLGTVSAIVTGVLIAWWAILVVGYLREIRDNLEILKRQRR